MDQKINQEIYAKNLLMEIGYKVYVVCDFTDESIWARDRIDEFKNQLSINKIECIQIDYSRNPIDVAFHLSETNLFNEKLFVLNSFYFLCMDGD